jgi:NAD(P)-dependent dehydrogenase (short-subunit alcohol dehydrogenase family)
VGGQLAFVPAAALHETTDEDWDLMFDLNLRYVAQAIRTTLRVFLAQAPAERSSASVRSPASRAARCKRPTAQRRRAWQAWPDLSPPSTPRRHPHERRDLRRDRNARRSRSPGEHRVRLDTHVSLGLSPFPIRQGEIRFELPDAG